MNSKIMIAAVLPAGLLLSACNASEGDADEAMEAPAEETVEMTGEMEPMAEGDAGMDATAPADETAPDDHTGPDERITGE